MSRSASNAGLVGTGLLLGILSAGCDSAEISEDPQWVSATRVDAAAIVSRLLRCEECTDGELQAVIALDERAQGPLASALADGPDARSLEGHRVYLGESWDALATDAERLGRPDLPVGRADFIAMFLDSFVALHRTRAAWALGRLGGGQARATLESTLATAPPTRVADAIQAALDSL